MRFIRQELTERTLKRDTYGELKLLSVSEFITEYDYKAHAIKIYTFAIFGSIENIELAAGYEKCNSLGEFLSLTAKDIEHCKMVYDKAISDLCELFNIKIPYSNYSFYLVKIDKYNQIFTLSVTTK